MKFFKFPKWLRWYYPGAIWDFFLERKKVIYLTFDDGPNPISTQWILNLLADHKAKATFFCLGKNLLAYPQLHEQIQKDGHRIGNHGMYHLSGFKTQFKAYLEDVKQAAAIINTDLFRPAYGRLTRRQYLAVVKMGYRVVFWSCLTYDFDKNLNAEKRMNHIRKATKPGSIFVFHDSEKAFSQLEKELPILIREWSSMGYQFEIIN